MFLFLWNCNKYNKIHLLYIEKQKSTQTSWWFSEGIMGDFHFVLKYLNVVELL